MEIQVLPVELYVAKYHECPRPRCRYEIDEGILYRTKDAESEDLGELPGSVDSVFVPAIELETGQYVGEIEAIERLRTLVDRVQHLTQQIHEVLRS
ncbi:hypothetical protein Pan216_08610 [Planctomycetes bacterium Pan216]|uniref:Uncharacterized protein n=1 Tax=Kolteria novifilia TaxID=2527975 RepID=A0A518AZ61_9BACT|nr:hypothetical protein Pan216_08610 [Planctomycetes bacterium Pan216]